MGISERKEREKQEMRKSIIDAAMHMFMYEGYENASIRKIADKIEYSPATIYLYYKDKDELLYDVQAQCFEKLVGIFSEKVNSEDPFTRLRQIGHAYIDFGLNNPEIYDLMFIMKSPMKSVEEYEAWHNGDDAFTFLVTCIAGCIERKQIIFTDVRHGALSVWAMAHGLISLNVCCRMKVMAMTQDQIEHGIYHALDSYLDTIKT